jgi:N-acetyl-gamma-glutamyl-phosphate reductase
MVVPAGRSGPVPTLGGRTVRAGTVGVHKVGVLGGSGFVGGELLRLLAGHPAFDLVVATGDRQAGRPVSGVHPHLEGCYPDLTLVATGAAAADGLDVVFCALPHGASSELVPDLLDRAGLVVDLGADFRLKDPAAYPRWYGRAHPRPDLLATAVHGIPELFGALLPGARLVAAAGCYVTAASLALAPLVAAGVIEATGVVVDAASGVTGAGREPTASTHFATVDEDFRAYGLLDHRHTPEIEQASGASVIFTPHLAPMNRGILATCYGRAVGHPDALGVLEAAYADSPFVVVGERLPSTKAVLGSNMAQVSAHVDARTGWVVALTAIWPSAHWTT